MEASKAALGAVERHVTHKLALEGEATTVPSCVRPIRRPVQGCKISEAWRIRPRTRLPFTGELPGPRLARLSRAVARTAAVGRPDISDDPALG